MRRRRSLGFLLAALVAAVAAATIADGYGKSVARGYGELRPVVVATAELSPERPIDPETSARRLEVRQVPVSFAPPDALRSLPEAVGLVPSAPIAPGSYLLASQLRPPRSPVPGPELARGRHPVEIEVSGAGALAAAGAGAVGRRVDVVVTTEPPGSGGGRTYVAAAAVPLLGLGAEASGEGTVPATLGLTRGQALRLIAAESFARRLTVIPR